MLELPPVGGTTTGDIQPPRVSAGASQWASFGDDWLALWFGGYIRAIEWADIITLAFNVMMAGFAVI